MTKRSNIGRGAIAAGLALSTLAAPAAMAVDTSIPKASDKVSRVEIRQENGKVTVWLNGEEVPASNVEHKDGMLIVTDEDGNVVKRIGWPGGFEGYIHLADAPQRDILMDDVPPPVMVGINMSEPGPALRYHLGLSDDTPAIMIDRVVPGLPAAEAGLQRYDIVVSIDGSDGATPAVLGKALRDKTPGQTLELEVIRKGQPETVTLELVAYDAKKLNTPTSERVIGIDGPGVLWQTDPDDLSKLDPEDLAERIAKLTGRGARFDGDKFVIDSTRRAQEAAAAAAAASAERAKALDARLTEMEKLFEARLAELQEHIERLSERLEERRTDKEHED